MRQKKESNERTVWLLAAAGSEDTEGRNPVTLGFAASLLRHCSGTSVT